MIPDYFEEQLARYSSEFFLYPWHLLELRLQEEMIRSDRSGSPFCFVELDFAHVERIWPDSGAARMFCAVFLDVLATNARGSDIKGYLEKDRGIGVAFLDSHLNGWQQFYTRLEARIQQDAPEIAAALPVWEKLPVRIEYPECVRTEQNGAAP